MPPILDGTADTNPWQAPTRAQLLAAFVFENPLRPVLLAILAAEIVWVVA